MNMPQIRHIDAALPFVDSLAQTLLMQRKDDPLALARSLILLPSRRACRNLREAFLRVSDGAPLLLPRILPLGELDNEWDLAAFTQDEPQQSVMPQRRRLALLTRLIMQAEKRPPGSSYQLATDLARLLDEATRYGIGFDRLDALAPLELAAHWQKTTEFLKLITHQWPRILEAEGMIDQATYVQHQLRSLANHWRKNPPPFPVMIAGATGHVPATAELMLSIASMPQGMVILPGLDRTMPQHEWDMLESTHPQFGLKQFLEQAEVDRKQVQPLAQESPEPLSLRAVFAPAPLTAKWRDMALPLEQELSHITLLEASTQADEARMIAYHLRRALDVPRKTAALITPDRALARMVASELARYGITVDDSAGLSLSDSPPAVFMQLLMEAALSGMAPGALLALLRHPFAAAGMSTARCRDFSRVLELRFLRGVRLNEGMDALLAEVQKESKLPDGFALFIERLQQILRPLELLFANNRATSLANVIDIVSAAAEALATTDQTPGAALLWGKEAGQQLATQLGEWKAEAAHLGALAPRDVPAFLSAMMEDCTIRRPYGQHPRLHILSPVESRLAHFDLVILGELSEGTWPASLSVDPWMSAPMRSRFGLPDHAAGIGQSAQDIWMLLPSKEVILTRARKIMSSPAEPSRWWVRLVTLVKGKNPELFERMQQSAQMQATIEMLNAPAELAPLTRPAPIPPREAAARKFSVSAFDLWRRDAYAFYAKTILRLHELDALDAEPDASDFGNIMHRAFELFSCAYPNALPEHAYQLLLLEGEKIFRDYANRPAVKNLWWPRFEAIARHWLVREQQLRQEPYESHCEVSAAWKMQVAGEDITLTARADRVDMQDGSSRLIDYKTGTIPKAKDVNEAKALQLPLSALALHYDGKLGKLPDELIYWGLKTKPKKDDNVTIGATEKLFEDTAQLLFAFIEEMLSGRMEYAPNAKADDAPGAKAYKHLSRHSEWISN